MENATILNRDRPSGMVVQDIEMNPATAITCVTISVTLSAMDTWMDIETGIVSLGMVREVAGTSGIDIRVGGRQIRSPARATSRDRLKGG